MHYKGLKQAARQCLRDSRLGPCRLTLLFLLCFYAVSILCDVVSYVMDLRLSRASGLEVAALNSQAMLWNFTAVVAVNLLWALWHAGYSAFALRLSRGQQTGFGEFLTGFRMAGKILAVTLLEALYIWLWSLLLVLPGIAAAYRYRMAVYVILDDPSLSASEAIGVSARLTYGHKLELFLLDLSFWWYYLPGLAAAALLNGYSHGLIPALNGPDGRLFVYLVNLLLPAAMDVAAMAYVQTTQAHAYNWLLSLDDAQRKEAWSTRRPEGWA